MTVRIGTNEVGGTFHGQGVALAEALRRRAGIGAVDIVATPSASNQNAELLERGEVEFGFMAANWVGRACRGEPPFRHPIALRIASPANAGPMFFVARRDSGLATVSDLVGRRLAVGLEGGGMVQHVRTIFDALAIRFADITPVYAGFAEGADMLAAGAVDAQWQCPIPNPVMTALAGRVDVRVLAYAEGELERVLARVPFYRRAVVSKGAFRGVERDTAQVGVLNLLVSHERVDAGLVCEVVRAMVEGADALAAANPLYRGLGDLYEPLRAGEATFEALGAKLHAGARRAYHEAGYL